MTRGSKKELSVRHENYVADMYGGRRSPSSGASIRDKGDVRSDVGEPLTIECKMTTSASKPTYVKQFEKIFDEAKEEGRTPILALRFYDPSSHLADANGWIDLAMTTLYDHACWYGQMSDPYC